MVPWGNPFLNLPAIKTMWLQKFTTLKPFKGHLPASHPLALRAQRIFWVTCIVLCSFAFGEIPPLDQFSKQSLGLPSDCSLLLLSALYYVFLSNKFRLPMDTTKVQPLPFMLPFCSTGFSILLGMEFFLLHDKLSPLKAQLNFMYSMRLLDQSLLGPSLPDLLLNWHTSPYFRLTWAGLYHSTVLEGLN